VIVGGESTSATDLERAIAARYLPSTVTLALTAARQAALSAMLPFAAEMKPVDGQPAAYVCRNFTCLAPVTSVEGLEANLKSEI
jgi:hypothetical protein